MEENETSSSTEEVNYRYTEDWINRCLVRDRMRKKNDHEIGAWLRELEKEKSVEYCNELRKLLREEWEFVRDASRLRNFQKT